MGGLAVSTTGQVQARDFSHESLTDEYIELMEEIKNNPSNTSLLAKYADYMTKYADLAKKFESMEDEEMTDEEHQITEGDKPWQEQEGPSPLS